MKLSSVQFLYSTTVAGRMFICFGDAGNTFETVQISLSFLEKSKPLALFLPLSAL